MENWVRDMEVKEKEQRKSSRPLKSWQKKKPSESYVGSFLRQVLWGKIVSQQ